MRSLPLPALIVVPVVLGACSLLQGETTVSSDTFPGVVITCKGEAVLPMIDCRAWGERLLAGMPKAHDATRLVLTFHGGNRRCAADFFGGDGRLLATAAAVCPVPARP